MTYRNLVMSTGMSMLAVLAFLATARTIRAELVAHYTFDTDFTDSAGATFENGVGVGGVAVQSGTVKVGSGALELDGGDDSVDLPYAGELDFDLVNDSFSAMAWVYLRSSSTNYQHVFITHDQASGDGRVWLALVDPSPSDTNATEDTAYEFIGGPGGEGHASSPSSRDAWHHIAVTQNNTSPPSPRTNLYVDGLLVNTSPDPAEAASGGQIRIGKHKVGSSGKGLNGFLDDLRFYNEALTAEQIAALVLSGNAGDYNGNGVVDAADYTVWRDSLGQTGAGLAADGNGDTMVDQADYTHWKERFGNAVGSGSASATGAAVPEPASWLIACVMAMATSIWQRRSPSTR